MRVSAWIRFTAVLLGVWIARASDTTPSFAISYVRESAPQRFPFMRGPYTARGRFQVFNASMAELIGKAYDVELDNVWGGPSWLEMARYDVTGKIPEHTKSEEVKTLLQSLLVERFQLAAHVDKKPMPAFGLRAGKRPQLKKSEGGETGCKFSVDGAPQDGGPPATTPTGIYTCHNMTMAAFAAGMRDMPMASQYLNNAPVLDETALEGAWDFTLKYSLRGFAPARADSIVTIADAVDKQLGLRLESEQAPMPVVVVDSVNRKPTENAADAMEKLQIAGTPAEFDVAAIKPTAPDFQGARFQIQPGGRVNLQGVTLKLLMQQVWNLTDEMLVGAPKWFDSDRWDIVAKAPSTALTNAPASGPNQQPSVDFETVLTMMKNLMADRFKLAVHTEERTIPAYTLLPGKPKMKAADPATRTRYQEGPASDGKDPRNKNPVLGRLVTVQNMTMAQFAERLQAIAPGYIHSPVLDSTGLQGGWDFTLSFSPAGAVGGGGRGGRDGAAAAPADRPGDALAASERNGALTLFEAIDKQLGLKLELQKRPVAVVVIDRVEQKPTDN